MKITDIPMAVLPCMWIVAATAVVIGTWLCFHRTNPAAEGAKDRNVPGIVSLSAHVLIIVLFSLPAFAFVLIGWLCVDRDPIWLLNEVGPFIAFFGHGLFLLVLIPIAVSVTPRSVSSRNVSRVITGIVLACVYVPCAIISWGLTVIGTMSF